MTMMTTQQLIPSALCVTINAITTSNATTAEEQALGTFTRRKLKRLPNWPQWSEAKFRQLDRFADLEMYGEPQALPVQDEDDPYVVLRSHWQHAVKRCGTCRSRQCVDGSCRAAPILHVLADSYSSCVNQLVQRLFMAIYALKNNLLFGGDARDAYAHAWANFSQRTFVRVDAPYIELY